MSQDNDGCFATGCIVGVVIFIILVIILVLAIIFNWEDMGYLFIFIAIILLIGLLASK